MPLSSLQGSRIFCNAFPVAADGNDIHRYREASNQEMAHANMIGSDTKKTFKLARICK